MIKLKIISNPYTREIEFLNYNEKIVSWENICNNNENSKLREFESDGNFLPFKIKEIIDIIIQEYYIGNEKIQLYFDGTQDEFFEVENVCNNQSIQDKVELSRDKNILENARIIFQPIKEIFSTVQPIIEDVIKDDKSINKNLNKVSDALKDIIPICVFGNYSAGKSTFINALIGEEILPSGGDPVTAKVYKIERSKYEDTARIKLTYLNEMIDMVFENTEYRLLHGNTDNELVQEIFTAIEQNEDKSFYSNIRIALDIINGFEKKDRDTLVISDEIDMEVPFSKKGILGRSYNNFVIFDTPGSNSESNADHYKVLEGALDGFSNGIPVWVSTYESVDSTDNASLCEKILNIKALDKRFAMIILNKADGSDLDEGGFSNERENEILEYSSVEKMYASGIYFVSSVMGLGSKKNEGLIDKHYRKVFRSQKEMYCDPEDEDYISLYKYNIMPYQIKKNVVRYSENCSDIIYANSGLYCVEQEMENFATKYAAYNKCQMVYMFLNSVIKETDKRIVSRKETLTRTRDARKKELEIKKAQLIDIMDRSSAEAEKRFSSESKLYKDELIKTKASYKLDIDALHETIKEFHDQNAGEKNFEIQQIQYNSAKDKLISNVMKNGKDVFSKGGNFLDKIGKMKNELVQDLDNYKDNRDEKASVEKEIDKETSDDLLKNVIEQYKVNLSLAQGVLSDNIKLHWQENAQSLRNQLVAIITGTDALSSEERDEMTNIIINYQVIKFDDEADSIFVKTHFLRGMFWGIQLIDDEKLNIKKLASKYNNETAKMVKAMATDINEKCENCFNNWQSNLLAVIEQNITDYSPELRDMSAMIKEENDKIAELEYDQSTIQQSLKEIGELMAWKNIEGE